MTIKELSQIYCLGKEIARDRERLARLRETVASPSSSLVGSGVSHGSFQGSTLEKYVAEIVDLEAIINAKIVQCAHQRNRIERYIAGIDDSLTRQIFTERFIKGKRWSAVAYAVGSSEDAVKKICYRFFRAEAKTKKGPSVKTVP